MNHDFVEMAMDWMSDAVSRFIRSPSYLQPLLEFIDENCATFEDKEDNRLEHTIHENFKRFVDGLISDYLASLDVPVHEFVQNLARHINEEAYDTLVNSILTVDDFILFTDMMLKRNSQLDDEDDFYEPMDLELLEGLNITQTNDLDEVIKLCYQTSELQKVQIKETADLHRNSFMFVPSRSRHQRRFTLPKEEKDIDKIENAPEGEHRKVAAYSRSPRSEASTVTCKTGVLVETPSVAGRSHDVSTLVPSNPNFKELFESTSHLQPQIQCGHSLQGAVVAKRRDHMVQQRDQNCSQKKVEREKQIRTTNDSEGRRSNPYLQQYLKRESFAKPTIAQDAEAVKRRESLTKELSLKLKDELVTTEIKAAEKNFHAWEN